MNKNIIAIIIAVVLISGGILLSGVINTDSGETTDNPENNQEEVAGESDEELVELVECLAENDLVIYGAEWCPACSQLVASLGGYETADPVYVECTETGTAEEQQQCRENTETEYVPEIQISGEVYEGARDPSSLGAQVGCEY